MSYKKSLQDNFLYRTTVAILEIILGIFISLLAVGSTIFLILVKISDIRGGDTINGESILSLLIMFGAGGFSLLIVLWMLRSIALDIKRLLFVKKCPLCAKTAYDTLTADKEIGQFCRQHLIEKYKQYFKISPFNVVMVEYQPSGISAPVYFYYPVSEIDFTSSRYPNSDDDIAAQKTVRHLLDVIKTKKCERCSRQASILFVKKEITPFSKYKTTPRKEFEQKGEYLCKEHALEKISPSIRNSSKHFDIYEGLCLPHKEDGYQATVAF